MGLDVGDRLRPHPGHQVGGADDLRLPVDPRGREPGLGRAVVVDRRALDDGADRVPVLACLLQPFQHHEAGPLAADRPFSARVESAAVPVGREDAVLLIEVA